VAANYRLGALGFLVTDTLKGNFGFQDQRAALHWVQRNAWVFGGNNQSVTLFGESAGAMSTGLHLVSPYSKGLFHRIIMESNPTGLLYKDNQHASYMGMYFCQLLNCLSADNTHCNETCIRGADEKDLLSAWGKSADNAWIYIEANLEHLIDGFLGYDPTIDGDQIPMEPIAALEAGQFTHNVPILFGSNKNEAITFIYEAVNDPVPMWFYDIAVLVVWPDHYQGILNQYQNSTDTDGRVPFCEVLTDYMFACAQEQFGVAASNAGIPTYAYRYNHVFSAGWIFPKFGLPVACANATCHAAELPFVFHNEVHTDTLNVSFTAPEKLIAQSFVDYWTTFAHTGNPNSAKQMQWPLFDPVNRATLFINEQSTIQSTAEVCQFWDAIGYNTIDTVGPRTLSRYPPEQREAIMQRIKSLRQ